MNRATLRLTDEFGDVLEVDIYPGESPGDVGSVVFDCMDVNDDYDRLATALSPPQTRELIAFLEENL